MQMRPPGNQARKRKGSLPAALKLKLEVGLNQAQRHLRFHLDCRCLQPRRL